MVLGSRPDVICVQLQPGEARSERVTVPVQGVARRIGARLVDSGDLVRLTQLLTLRTVRRRLTEDEIQELPPRPPSIRENARRHGIEETIEITHTSGSPVGLQPGVGLDVELGFSVPTQTSDGIVAARLQIDDVLGRTELPAICVVGRATATPQVEPARLRVALQPGESTTRAAIVAQAPVGDSVVSEAAPPASAAGPPPPCGEAPCAVRGWALTGPRLSP